MPGILTLCDWIDVITYDIHGLWDERTGLVAPFTAQPRDEEFNETGNVVSILERFELPKKVQLFPSE